MKSEALEKRIDVAKNIIIMILLSIWFIIPLLKSVRCTFAIDQYKCMQIIGLIGVYLLIMNIARNFYIEKDKGKYCIQILPIIIFTIYMLWTLISCIFSPDTDKAFYGTEYRKEGYITYLIYAGFFSLAFLVKTDKCKKYILNMFLLIAICNCIIMQVIDEFKLINIFRYQDIKFGMFLNENHYGYYLLLVTTCANFLFVTADKWYTKILYLASYVFLMYYLILNNTFGCYLALASVLVIFLAYSIYKKNKVIISIISILVFLIMSMIVQENGKNIVLKNINYTVKDIKKIVVKLTNQEDQTTKVWKKEGAGRMKLWVNGINFFLERPLLGYGPENLGKKYIEVNITNQDRPHNLILQLATTSGFPGAILYMSAVRTYYDKSNKATKK